MCRTCEVNQVPGRPRFNKKMIKTHCKTSRLAQPPPRFSGGCLTFLDATSHPFHPSISISIHPIHLFHFLTSPSWVLSCSHGSPCSWWAPAWTRRASSVRGASGDGAESEQRRFRGSPQPVWEMGFPPPTAAENQGLIWLTSI